MGKYKVLVTYVEAGMGHIISAEAVANALEKYYPDEVEVIRCNIFTDTNDKLLIKYQQFLIDEVKKSNKHPFHMFYLKLLRMRLFPRLSSLIFAHATIFLKEKKKVIAIMKGFDPDMVFNTHFVPLHFAIEAQKKHYGGHFLTAVYNPDPNVHGWWDRRGDLSVFNNQGAYVEAVKNGFKPENCLLSRFVIREKVRATPKDKLALRRKHYLPENQFTITLASSAYAGGHLRAFAERIMKINRRFTLLIIAGSNDEVYEEMNAKVGTLENVNLQVYRFVPDAHELYGASDIFITKAGPNAILDSVYMDTPVMTNFCASIIEQVTKAYYIDEHKTGVHFTDKDEAADFLLRCMDNPAVLEPYVENCRAFIRDHTGGEKEIADAIVEKLRKNGPPKADAGQTPTGSGEEKLPAAKDEPTEKEKEPAVVG